MASISAFNIELLHQSLAIRPERRLEFVKASQASGGEHQKHGILGYVSLVNEAQGAELVNLA